MLYQDCIEKLLGLQDVIPKKIESDEGSITIYGELKRKSQLCPRCQTETRTIHDYRTQRIKDIPAFGKRVTLVLRKRRYRCPHCAKRFFEKNMFLPRYRRRTNRLSVFVLDRLRSTISFTDVAKEDRLSVSTVIRTFDTVSYPRAQLTSALSIDEFKGNTWGEKYQCILTGPANRVVLDILPKRYGHALTDYLNSFPFEERQRVRYFVSDMWRPHSELSAVWFRNAVQIVDKYHWIRQAIWAFEHVRKEEQKKFGKTYRRYFKRSRSLLTRRFAYLTEEQKQQVHVMLYISVNLSRAHYYKEEFLRILDSKDRQKAKTAMLEWIESARNCGIPQFEKCAMTMQNWLDGILNSFSTPLTNGFTEGCNNKIKVLKRNAYGHKNFRRFRNRILHMFFHQKRAVRKQATA